MFFNLINNFFFVEATLKATSRKTKMLKLFILLLRMFLFMKIESRRTTFAFFFTFFECLNHFFECLKFELKKCFFKVYEIFIKSSSNLIHDE
jgi:hypothetical protein